MMGQGSGGHRQLFYSFNLNDHVPPDHLLRGITGASGSCGLLWREPGGGWTAFARYHPYEDILGG